MDIIGFSILVGFFYLSIWGTFKLIKFLSATDKRDAFMDKPVDCHVCKARPQNPIEAGFKITYKTDGDNILFYTLSGLKFALSLKKKDIRLISIKDMSLGVKEKHEKVLVRVNWTFNGGPKGVDFICEGQGAVQEAHRLKDAFYTEMGW